MNARWIIGFVLCSVFAPALTASGQEASLDRFTYHFDFESGSVGPWSSYPPAQDTAYDPTIWVKPMPGRPGLCLVREIQPHRPSRVTFGMRKKLAIQVDSESVCSFSYFIKNYGQTEGLIVRFAFDDGTGREVKLPAGKNMEWHEAEIRPAPFLGEKQSLGLDAVAVMAVCAQADPESMLKLAIDDLKITGWRRKPLVIEEPPSHWLEEFGLAVSGVHFDEASDLRIRGVLPEPADRTEMTVSSVMRPDRKMRLPLRKKPPRSFEIALPARNIGPGLWRADIRALRSGTPIASTTLVFLVRPSRAPAEHPYLLFTKKDLPRLRQLILQGRGRDIWDKLQADARALRQKYHPEVFNYNLDAYDEIFWLPTYGGYSNTIRTLSSYARENAFVYAVGQEREAGEAARKALLKMADWPSFVHPHILNQGQFTYWPVGLVLIDLAVAYDLVYDLLAPEERTAIASALYNKGVTEVFKEYVRDNRVSSNTSNWISHVAGGGLLAAIAISREYGEKDLEPYLTGMILKTAALVEATFDRDGHYGEGYAYHNFTMQTLTEIMPLLETHFDIAFPEKVFRSYLYLPYQMDPVTKGIYDFGDTSARLSSMSNFAYLLKKTKDPLLRWLYDLSPGNRDVDLIFFAEDVAPEPPSARLPLIKLFRDTGTAVFRSGFGTDDFLFVFRAGPFYNHQHFDQGTFFLRDRGQDFIVEGGRTDYYNDPWYQRFFIQPAAHNCLLPDGEPACQRAGDLQSDVPAWQDAARITDALDFREGAFCSAELSRLYEGKFQSLRRSLLFLAPRTVVLIDHAAGAREVNELHLRFHAPQKRDIAVRPGGAEIHRGEHTLHIQSLFPEALRLEVRKRPLSLSEFGAENPITMSARGFLEMAVPVQNGTCQVINLMSTDPEVFRRLRFRPRPGCFELSTETARFLISASPAASYEAGRIATDALVCSVDENAVLALHASAVREGPKPLFEADIPVSVRLETGKGTVFARIWAAGPTRVRLATPRKPRTVKLDGRTIQTWTYEASRVGLGIPPNESRLTIEY